MARASRAAARERAHQDGKRGAATAQGASAPEKTLDIASQAADLHTADMAAHEPGTFDAAAFKIEVKKAIEGMAPPATLEEADEFQESGKAGEAAGTIAGLVTAGRQGAAQPIATSTAATPDTSKLKPKTVETMVNDRPGAAVSSVGAVGAVPDPAPAATVDLSAGPRQVDGELAAGNLTVEQLQNANEPEFTQALDARQEVAEHAEADPVAYRGFEAGVLPETAAEVTSVEGGALLGMHAARSGTLSAALAVKGSTRDADQQQQDAVHRSILGIHEQTKSAVQDLLTRLNKSVNTTFVDGEKAARETFERYVDVKMREYKDDRYSGWGGGALWLKDKAFDLPDEVNDFYAVGRTLYLHAMDRLLDVIAAQVTLMLTAAQVRILLGRQQVEDYVKGLPTWLTDLGTKTASRLDQRFDMLSAEVDAARDQLVDTVAHAYVDATSRLDARITELQEANKGFVSKAVDFVKGVAKTIYELGQLLLRVLIKAASVIGDIVAHPIRFLENLVAGIKGGLDKFVANFGRHLQESMLDLLLGELGRTGIRLPKSLDFAGIFDLVCQVLGLTYADIRRQLALRFGETTVLRMEQTVDVFALLAKEDLAGIWGKAREQISELPGMVIGAIEKYIVEKVITAGIGYIVALLTPFGAFIKACQGIIAIVGFIVDKAKQIADFVDAVLDSISAIAQGNVSAAVDKVDQALAGALTLAIAFLAKLAHLDGIGKKVHSIITAIRAPVKRGVDGIIDGAVALYQRTAGALGPAKSGAAVQKVPTHPTAPQEPPASSTIDEPVRMRGHLHHLINDGPGGALVLHSNGGILLNTIADPALQALVAAYNAARTQKDRHAAAEAVADWISANNPTGGPGGSAPGIGEIQRHGSKPPGLVNAGVPLWSLQSEHIIPFTVMRGLWDVIGVQAPAATRKMLSWDDANLTTIMIYQGAAVQKNSLEGGRRTRLAAEFSAMGERYWRRPDAGDQLAEDVMRRWVNRALQRELSWYLNLTWTVVQNEHAARDGDSTRGARRVEGSPLPQRTQIDDAGAQELADANTILAEALIELRRPERAR